MANVLINAYKNTMAIQEEILEKELGFKSISLRNQEIPRIPSKLQVIKAECMNVILCLKKWKEFNHSNTIIASGYFVFILGLLNKLKILDCTRIISYGFFIHSPRMINIFKAITRICCSECFKFVVFSKYEVELYSKKFKINKTNFIYIPYGDWNKEKNTVGNNGSDKYILPEGQYYFAGGYSNRDYVSLIEEFKKLPYRLLIAASSNNSDLVQYLKQESIPSNVTVIYDCVSGDFERILQGSVAVIFPMRDNTGASGQMVIIAAMRNKKLIISTNTDVIKEYIRDKEEGIILGNIRELGEVLTSLERGGYTEEIQIMRTKAYQRYCEKYTYAALKKQLITALGE